VRKPAIAASQTTENTAERRDYPLRDHQRVTALRLDAIGMIAAYPSKSSAMITYIIRRINGPRPPSYNGYAGVSTFRFVNSALATDLGHAFPKGFKPLAMCRETLRR